MLTKLLGKVMLVGLLTSLVSCTQPAEQSNPSLEPSTISEDTKVIVLGDISKNPAKKIRRFQPLANYLADKLSQFDINTGEVKIASDFPTMISWLKEGEVHLYFDSLYPAMRINQESGAQPILRRWKRGDAEYHTIIFTMKDRGIKSLADLKGKKVAFDDRQSTSGYMLPMAYLIEAGLKPNEKGSASDVVAANEVGYIFSDDDENTIQWVISSKADAGAVDNQTFEQVPKEVKDAMTILAETDKVPRQVVMVPGNMDPELMAQLKSILSTMHNDPKGKEVLTKFQKTAKFDEFPTLQGLERMQQLYNIVENR
ncbi:MAG: phosphate/phosphite/phosphonate ABC transporter substrate-binding protein [Moorea sp. SIO2I5]|nr:phosphate/phosphite/phosphonate ABC transporter substrate-binding protein [Moorena sp. SIO2I5]